MTVGRASAVSNTVQYFASCRGYLLCCSFLLLHVQYHIFQRKLLITLL